MKTILASVDFSPVTNRVCAEAVALAKSVNGRVILLHSIPPPIITTELGPGIENILELGVIAQKTAVKQLAQLRRKWGQKSVLIESVLLDGAPGPQILKQAEKLAADYIVLGTHGHTALYDLLVGSTAHHVLKKTSCPVLAIPPARKSKPMPLKKKAA